VDGIHASVAMMSQLALVLFEYFEHLQNINITSLISTKKSPTRATM